MSLYISRTLVATAFLLSSVAWADIIYATGNGGQLLRFSADGVPSVVSSGVGNVNGGLALDGSGNIFWADSRESTIYKVTPGGARTVFATDGLLYPHGLAVDHGGNLYVANHDNTILKFTPQGLRSVFATGLEGPLGLAFDRSGNLFSADFGDSTINKFNPNGVRTVVASYPQNNGFLAGPYGLALDASDNLFAANEGGNTIVKFTPGGIGSVFATTGLSSPCGLAFDSAGNLYAANQNGGTITRFAPDGTPSVFANGLYDGPVYLAIQQVPEPSTWMILSCCLVAVVVRGTSDIRHASKRRNLP